MTTTHNLKVTSWQENTPAGFRTNVRLTCSCGESILFEEEPTLDELTQMAAIHTDDAAIKVGDLATIRVEGKVVEVDPTDPDLTYKVNVIGLDTIWVGARHIIDSRRNP